MPIGGPYGGPVRREPRVESVRAVEYSHFPRFSPEQTPRLGFTRDVSASGMCVGADAPEPVGALLRVTVRGVDGASLASLERVVWCSGAPDGRWWIGLERVCDEDPGGGAHVI